MATWYVDYEGGTNANASVGNGDSFATRRKTIDNCVAAAIAPGDTIRIMGSPDSTSLGQTATWTDGPLQTTKAIVSSTNATPIVITLSGANYTALAPAVGDTLIVNGHTTNTKANGVWKISAVNGSTTVTIVNADGTNSVGNGVGGASGTVRKFSNAVVGLTTAVTQNIAECGNQGVKANWAASANVICTKSTADFKEGAECQSIAIAAGFTTGLAAYVATGTLNLSGYQQVSFWVKQTVGTIGLAGATRLRLCTDTAGATPVHDCPIPALGALNQWFPVVVNLGTNLNAAIQSISFDVVTDNAAQTFLIDNVIACKAASSADSLNLTSLISKNTGDEAWFGIQSINGTRVVLDGAVNSIPAASPQRGYSGTTETVTTYKRETIKTVAAATNVTNVQSIQDTGTVGSLITFSGGWNRTDMSTQTGVTWFDGQNGLGVGVYDNSSYTYLDKINAVRYYYGMSIPGSDVSIGQAEFSNLSNTVTNVSGPRLTATKLSAVCCGGPITSGPGAIVTTIARADSTTSGNGVTLGAGSWTGTITQANNNANIGALSGVGGYIGTATTVGNGNAGHSVSARSIIGNLTTSSNTTHGITGATEGWVVLGGSSTGNTSGGVQMTASIGTLRNFTINEATEVAGFTAYNNARVFSEKHDGTANNTQIFCDGGKISTDATVTHGSAAYSWKFAPTSTNRSQYYPLNLPIAQIACDASALVTVTAWFRRSNTGLTAQLVCKGGQIAGVASDVTSAMTAAANTWEMLTISFTPSEAGVVEIEAQFWGGTAYNGYVSDATFTQS